MEPEREINEDFIEISSETYTKIASILLLEQYEVKNIRELIYAIYTLIKMDRNNRHITIKFVKERVSNRLYQSIRNKDSIYAIISKLIKLDEIYNARDRIPNIMHYEYLRDEI